jgi:hypothetical protein
MQSGEGSARTPQFETAEFQAKPGTDACFVCHQPISGRYYRANNRMACSPCAERLKGSVPKDSHAAFVRAMVFGAGAAIAGLALYAVFGIVTGLMIGYVSLAVGWLVGTAMMKGSGGLGGRRYQIAAVLFTYAAVSMAAIPIAIAESAKEKKAERRIEATSKTDQAQHQTPAQAATETEPAEQQSASDGGHRGMAAAFGYLALIGLASPFLELGSDPVHAFIGLVILIVGIRIAWRLTAGRPTPAIDGPF